MLLNFGKHKGKKITAVPVAYLEWLAGPAIMKPWVRRAAAAELARRQREIEQRRVESPVINDVPTAAPCTVCGINLDQYEAALLEQARRDGIMRLGIDVPLASRAPDAWRRERTAAGLPAPIVEDTEQLSESVRAA